MTLLAFAGTECSKMWGQTSPGEKPSTLPNAPSTGTQSLQLELPPVTVKSLPRNLLIDQKLFWTTPFRMTQKEWQWTVPLAFVGAGLLASDTAIEQHVPSDPTTVSHANTASNVGLAALVGAGGGMFLWGHLEHNDQSRETGLLSGEAAINAFLDTEALKYATGRERPFTGSGRGLFFQGDDSFPSQHAAVSWAIASVIAHEYPGPLTQLLTYGVAGGVSAARVAGHKHFTTDALVGSALGWYVGRQVFNSHSRYNNVFPSKWDIFGKHDDGTRDPGNMGSPYVPLDSWVYPAMERLIALGYIRSADLGMRPWTRMECARLLREAGNELQNRNTDDGEAHKISAALKVEFSDEWARLDGAANTGVRIDSVYTRFMGISGTPLDDGLHFGQTIINDYGRPYGEGFNNVTGLTSYAVAGPLSFYLQAEYEHAAPLQGFSPQTAQTIQAVDGLPVAPSSAPTETVNKLDLLQGYVGVQLNNWQFSFGKQELWWGPDESGAMLFSDNAAPILMLQINRVKPFRLPSVFGLLGDIRFNYIVGRLTDYHWLFSTNTGFTGSWEQTLSDPPFIVGQKFTFKPTTNLELGVSATALFGGTGVPATPHKLFQAMFSSGNGLPGTPGDAGDRRGGFDFTYRVPGLRDWLTVYLDAFTDDESNPWLAWNKAALTSGLFLPKIPKLPKLSLRAEGLYTDPPSKIPTTMHGFFYINSRFKSGYTNGGNLIGSWIGRQGQGAMAWATYSFSPRTKLQFDFRHQKVSRQFIPSGGTLTDFGVSADYQLRSSLILSGRVQHERWLFPAIQPNANRNVTAAIQITLEPHDLFRK
jgi:hypothetical protein